MVTGPGPRVEFHRIGDREETEKVVKLLGRLAWVGLRPCCPVAGS